MIDDVLHIQRLNHFFMYSLVVGRNSPSSVNANHFAYARYNYRETMFHHWRLFYVGKFRSKVYSSIVSKVRILVKAVKYALAKFKHFREFMKQFYDRILTCFGLYYELSSSFLQILIFDLQKLNSIRNLVVHIVENLWKNFHPKLVKQSLAHSVVYFIV